LSGRKQLSQRPYLLRAMHAWISDNGETPHVVVDATAEGISAPPGYDREGKLVLNISYEATVDLDLGAEELSFNARFSGISHHVRVPLRAILGIYAQETGRGMIFPEDDAGESPQSPPDGDGGGRPKLRVVK
jgi:stringent starvation protein B